MMNCFKGLIQPLLSVLQNISLRLSVMEVRMVKGHQPFWIEEAIRQVSNSYNELCIEADDQWIQSVVLRNFKL